LVSEEPDVSFYGEGDPLGHGSSGGKFREIACFGLASVATTLWPSHGSEITRDLSNVYFAKKNTFANIIWFHTGSVKSFLGFLIVKKVSDHFLS
jgi:hypothetical protein